MTRCLKDGRSQECYQMRLIAGLIAVMLGASSAAAQTQDASGRSVHFDLTMAGFASFQEGTGENLSYGLDSQLSRRTMFGFGVEGAFGEDNGFVLAVDVSKTGEIEASAGGRAVGP